MADEEREQTIGIETQRRPVGIYDSFVLPILAEFVGVCFYVFIGVLAVPYGAYTALAEGLSIALFMMTLGQLSGGHFNPAVTLGVAIAGGMRLVLVPFFFIAQILGGMLGAAFARAVLQNYNFKQIHGGTSFPDEISFNNLVVTGVGWRILGEGLLTGLWVFTFLMTVVNVNGKEKKIAPFAVGFLVIVGKLASISSTGGSMNPARSFGPAVVYSGLNVDVAWKDHYVYWVGPAAGTIVAAIVYRLLFAKSNRRWLFKSEGDQFLMP